MTAPKLTGPISSAPSSATAAPPSPTPAPPTPASPSTTGAPTDRVTSLPDLGAVAGVQFAGYASIYGSANPMPASSLDEGLFYWFAGTDDYASRPTVLWTNGGPGSSSFWGFFTENGPYEFDAAGRIQLRADAWNNEVNYMIFEHPLSVTLSYAADDNDVPTSPEMGIEQLYQALLNFLARHPELIKQPLVLAGESYAGTYLPLLAQAILAGNGHPGNPTLNLRGVVLLDAWVDPMVQMAQDTTYALAHGLISATQKQELDAQYTGPNLGNINEAIAEICGLYMANIAEQGDPPFDPVLAYLNRADVRQVIHAKAGPELTQSWSALVSNNYASAVNNSYAGTVANLLNQELPVLVMSGLNDAKDCNFLGTGAWLEQLAGAAADTFRAAPTTQWAIGSGASKQVLGFVQGNEGDLLQWVKVLNAGHLAVLDQPRILDLIRAKLLAD